jgi:hypothetical protein
LYQLPHDARLQICQLRTQVLNLRPETGFQGKLVLGSHVRFLCLQTAYLEVMGQVFYHLCQSNFRGALEHRGITLRKCCLGGVMVDAQGGYGQDRYRQGLGPMAELF